MQQMDQGECDWVPRVGEYAVFPGRGVARIVELGSDDAQKIWGILKKRTRRRTAHGVTWSRQFREYQDKVRAGSVFQVAEVLRDLLRLQTTKELSFGEHRLLENARTLIVGELAASQSSEADDVEREIRAAVI